MRRPITTEELFVKLTEVSKGKNAIRKRAYFKVGEGNGNLEGYFEPLSGESEPLFRAD